jgi:putative transposase
MLIEPAHAQLSIARQCQLLGLARSSFYYQPVAVDPAELALLRRIDEQYLRTPFFGSRQMCAWLRRAGEMVNRKRMQRLMRRLGLQGAVPGPHTSRPHPEHVVYPYLLGHLCIDRPNLVWSSDITYVPMARGYLYLVAVIDWYSRYVLAWALSNTLEGRFCVEALEAALARGEPVVFNTDQGAQFTSEAFTGQLKQRQILISMDGRGRALDNVFIERLWRTLKYEDIYLRDYADGHALHHGLECYFAFYNHARPHSALGGRTPAEVHGAGSGGTGGEAEQADSVWTTRACRKRPCGQAWDNPLPADCPHLAHTHAPVAHTAPRDPRREPYTPAARQQQTS